VKTLVSPILFAGPLLSQTIKIIENKEIYFEIVLQLQDI